jgi:hypothetical protein
MYKHSVKLQTRAIVILASRSTKQTLSLTHCSDTTSLHTRQALASTEILIFLGLRALVPHPSFQPQDFQHFLWGRWRVVSPLGFGFPRGTVLLDTPAWLTSSVSVLCTCAPPALWPHKFGWKSYSGSSVCGESFSLAAFKILFFFLGGTGIELNALPLEPHPRLLLCFSGRVSCFCLGHHWTTILLPLPPEKLGLQACNTMSCCFWDKVLLTFAWAGPKLPPAP